MDEENAELACGLISRTYVQQGAQALTARRRLVKALLSNRRLPAQGWDDATIELLLTELSLWDSNNFLDNVGVGEREARVASALVARRHWRLAHGVGRSGDVAAEQPKAAGSSLLARLAALLAGDALALAGLQECGPVLVLPLATGMAITTTLLALRGMRPPSARQGRLQWTVLWCRVDQKTCLKSITAAGYEVEVVSPRLSGDELVTDIAALTAAVQARGTDAIAAIVTTTSCFAPRAADDVVAVAKLCARAGVAHIVNNAYGVQSAALCAQVTSAWRKGRVDAVIQSTDKNFMVPVGGSIIAARKGHTQLVERVNTLYPGRASMAPALDLLITLLHWGAAGWSRALAQREALHSTARMLLEEWAAARGERVLATPGNPISLALTLSSLSDEGQQRSGGEQQQGGEHQLQQQQQQQQELGSEERQQDGEHQLQQQQKPGSEEQQQVRQQPWQQQGGGQQQLQQQQGQEQQGGGQQRHSHPPITFLGSMLFKRCVSGTRVVARGKRQEVGGLTFQGYGAHCDAYPCDYLTVAAALGTTEADIQDFLRRLDACFAEFRRKSGGRGSRAPPPA